MRYFFNRIQKEGHACGFSLLPNTNDFANTPLYFRDEEIYSSMKALDQVIDEEYASLSQLQLLRVKSEKKIKEKYRTTTSSIFT